ncbi:MAG: hypothetical protein ABJC61_07160 [Acidobacteriota bacterium]
MKRPRPPGWIAALLVALGLFSLGFSLLAERGLWPRLPPGALHDTDLVAGFAVVVGLIWLLWKEKSPAASETSPAGTDEYPRPMKTEDGKLKTEN